MIRILLPAFLLTTLAFAADPVAAPPKKPKLILAIVVDQFRYDYIVRFRQDYTAGLKRLLDDGAIFDDAHHISFPTVTALGHSTFLSGATPSQSGIVGNEWFERETKTQVTSVSDPTTTLVGGIPGAPGSSPHRLLVSTVGDEIKISGQKSKVIGISIKDRSAILPVGHMADAAYWFDGDSNHWTTSSYYMKELPKWVEAVNDDGPQRRAFGATWYPVDSKPEDKSVKPFCTMVAGRDDLRYCGSLEASPWGNELIAELAIKAIPAEQMGQHDGTDLLAVSFSSNDYVGHAVGPDAPEIKDISIRTDRLIGKLIEEAEKSAGAGNVVVVLTADHGVSPVPEVNTDRKMPGGRLDDLRLASAMSSALSAKYGEGKWLINAVGSSPYLNLDLIAAKKLNVAEVEETAADAARKFPHIYRVLTKTQITHGQMALDAPGTMIMNGYLASRAPDLVIIQDPFYLFGATGTSHGTPFNYDSHVPVIFMGNGIRSGHYYNRIAVNDIAPTLSAIAGALEPSGSQGRVLSEIFTGK